MRKTDTCIDVRSVYSLLTLVNIAIVATQVDKFDREPAIAWQIQVLCFKLTAMIFAQLLF